MYNFIQKSHSGWAYLALLLLVLAVVNSVIGMSSKKEFTAKNFIEDYNSYKGNAYGLANTLLQTAFLKPKLKNRKVSNLFYTGQLTVPGPGVPPAIISGKIVANEICNFLQSKS